MDFSKIGGFFLLIAGLMIIGWALYSSYNIFTAKDLAPEIFKAAREENTTVNNGKTRDIEAQIKFMLDQQLSGMIPADTVPQLLNLIAYSILATLFVFGGGQISGLGIKLLKK